MQALYLKRNEVSALLGMPETKAMAILASHGILPVDLGRGRGNGLRWRTSAVIQVADTLHAETQRPLSCPKKKRAISRPLIGKSAEDLDREFRSEALLQ